MLVGEIILAADHPPAPVKNLSASNSRSPTSFGRRALTGRGQSAARNRAQGLQPEAINHPATGGPLPKRHVANFSITTAFCLNGLAPRSNQTLGRTRHNVPVPSSNAVSFPSVKPGKSHRPSRGASRLTWLSGCAPETRSLSPGTVTVRIVEARQAQVPSFSAARSFRAIVRDTGLGT